jgi:hypothetical protein
MDPQGWSTGRETNKRPTSDCVGESGKRNPWTRMVGLRGAKQTKDRLQIAWGKAEKETLVLHCLVVGFVLVWQKLYYVGFPIGARVTTCTDSSVEFSSPGRCNDLSRPVSRAINLKGSAPPPDSPPPSPRAQP